MDITQAIEQRKSIRVFKADPVPRAMLSQIMAKALRSPSWANIQPWEFAIVTGARLAEIKKRFIAREGVDIRPDFSQAFEFPEPYRSRSQAAVAQSHAAAGIERQNKEQRKAWEIRQLSNFGAPCEIYIYTERSLAMQNGVLNVYPAFDCGNIAGTVALLAASYGLGTIIQARAVVYPGVVREVLGLPDSKMLLIGIAIGYPDWDKPLNRYATARQPLEELVHFYGFE